MILLLHSLIFLAPLKCIFSHFETFRCYILLTFIYSTSCCALMLRAMSDPVYKCWCNAGISLCEINKDLDLNLTLTKERRFLPLLSFIVKLGLFSISGTRL